jgi:tRNA threonylcarbamoyladenosine biosynthesis protein TsaB
MDMNLLALDSSQEILSVALAFGEGIWYTEIDSGPRHSELMMERVDNLFKSANLKPAGLDKVLCMKGPGSFTGLRISYAAAKGLAMALGISLVALPTLDCLAWHLSFCPGLVLPVMDAKQGRFFAAFYRKGKRLTDYMDESPKTLVQEIIRLRLSPEEPLVLTGSGAPGLSTKLLEHFPPEYTLLDPHCRRGRARELLEIAKSVISTETDDLHSGPLYLRKSDAELKNVKASS